ncbi:glycoside hydrolase family 35 protein [Propionibacteriaceae bacterium Y2011]|uniref:glycoside hydrolase family 35 protein n=1 Tax=Microlunatus sp. Y2014 TaxID=3418488 RepID=UPI003B46A587
MTASSATDDHTITVADGHLVRQGRPHRVLSGALHYFRVHPQQWRQRLELLRAMGLNCVETYVPWNLHEPRQGEFDFAGLGDLERFLDLAAEVGLDAIVRPGPYICAEWDAGGLPIWLLADESVPLRCADPRFLSAVDRWFDVLIPRIAVRQTTHGGNVIMVQVENEYGSYGSDRDYLVHLRDALLRHGITVPLFTSDGPTDLMLTGGTVDDTVATVNFGSGARAAFAELRHHRTGDPLFCMEFWCGWFTHWGHAAPTREPAEVAAEVADLLAAGGSLNLYMAHGGTNFAGWSGANLSGDLHDDEYRPTTTSYDYDAPIDELGRPTALFHALREVIMPYATGDVPPVPEPTPMLPDQDLTVTASAPLRAVLDAQPVTATAPVPPSFESLGVQYGLVRYRSQVPGPRERRQLHLDGLADLARVEVDGELVGFTERDGMEQLDFAVPGASATLEVLVEAMGRVNYGPHLRDLKGIRAVRHERQFVHGFAATALDLTTLPRVPWDDPVVEADEACFHRAEFAVDLPADTLVRLPRRNRGHLWVNGFALGRYWDRGPQDAWYVPGPLLRPGANELVLLEMGPTRTGSVQLRGA